jgi:hypothetical protein
MAAGLLAQQCVNQGWLTRFALLRFDLMRATGQYQVISYCRIIANLTSIAATNETMTTIGGHQLLLRQGRGILAA